MSAKKYLLLLVKAVLVYLVVFLIWIFVSPFYLHLIGFASARLLPVFLVEDYRVDSYQVEAKETQTGLKKNLIRYYILVAPQVRNWVEFGTNDLSYPLVTFFTLVLVTPKVTWKKRAKILVSGFVVLWLFYSVLALFFFRIIGYQDGRELAHLGLIEDLFGIKRLAAWKQSGGITILSGQIAPVAIWFVSVFGQLFKRSKPEKMVKQKRQSL